MKEKGLSVCLEKDCLRYLFIWVKKLKIEAILVHICFLYFVPEDGLFAFVFIAIKESTRKGNKNPVLKPYHPTATHFLASL